MARSRNPVSSNTGSSICVTGYVKQNPVSCTLQELSLRIARAITARCKSYHCTLQELSQHRVTVSHTGNSIRVTGYVKQNPPGIAYAHRIREAESCSLHTARAITAHCKSYHSTRSQCHASGIGHAPTRRVTVSTWRILCCEVQNWKTAPRQIGALILQHPQITR